MHKHYCPRYLWKISDIFIDKWKRVCFRVWLAEAVVTALPMHHYNGHRCYSCKRFTIRRNSKLITTCMWHRAQVSGSWKIIHSSPTRFSLFSGKLRQISWHFLLRQMFRRSRSGIKYIVFPLTRLNSHARKKIADSVFQKLVQNQFTR